MKIGMASIDENGKAYGGKAGDQTGNEVKICNWYKHKNGWNVIIRPKDRNKGAAMAAAMIAACENSNIGYDQYERETLLTDVKRANNDFSKITIPTETDCSALVATIIVATGTDEAKMRNPARKNALAYTGDLKMLCIKSGEFEILTDKKYLTSGDYLLKGDILLNEGSHAAMAIEDGPKAEKKEIKPEGFVDNLYKNALHREPDAEGKTHWINVITSGIASGSEVAKGFIFGSECVNRNLNNEEWILMLYRALLGREADEVGKKDWLKKLDKGTTRESVFAEFVASSEFKNYCEKFNIEIGKIEKEKYIVKVTYSAGLNVRTNPNVASQCAGSPLKCGTEVEILEILNGWGRIGENRWISLNYTNKI